MHLQAHLLQSIRAQTMNGPCGFIQHATQGFDLPLIGYLGAKAAGIAWGKVDSSDRTIVNVYQMWVAPECRGHGLARLLLRTIVERAASISVRSVQLAVVCGDSPAMRLYVSEG
jgi:GNAT superfamily N-acetyltransferase